MSSICLSFHVHQPFVLRRYSVFDSDEHYFDIACRAIPKLIAYRAKKAYSL